MDLLAHTAALKNPTDSNKKSDSRLWSRQSTVGDSSVQVVCGVEWAGRGRGGADRNQSLAR